MIAVPYTNDPSRTLKALEGRLDAMGFAITAGDEAYFYLLRALWQHQTELWWEEPLIVVEHDMIVSPDHIRELEACENPWCGFGYWRGTGYGPALGCTKFSHELITAVPDLFDRIAKGPDGIGWRTLDIAISRALGEAGYLAPCTHYPCVVHLNVPAGQDPVAVASWYVPGMVHRCWRGGRCQCQHGEGHACPIWSNPNGVTGVCVHSCLEAK